ncbi:MAG: PstS family phosphate ABC transporter substrate-binding protein [Myxococcales bacterium]|nr:PstS family phosphate ABC transporter substrate-binding protein [Myxococcales bacterium]MCB9749798.1 PstS family phosphate ABC transporter substrate-binding protein [Myxococcales bacterium]
MRTKHSGLALLTTAIALMTAACGGGQAQGGADASADAITVDGSSTVYPITEAVAEEFKNEGAGRVTIGVSGTGGGFKKFCKGEVEITGASRPIKPSEVESCGQAGVEYIELPVSYDGIVVVVHPSNTWVESFTVDELKKIWAPAAQGVVMKWSDVREGWPDKPLRLFGAGVDSGTYDYFTKAIVGEEHASRGDFTSSEDDNVLVQGISSDENALGFFGYAYYAENQDKLRVIPVDDGVPGNGDGPITPSVETVADATYQPLSRPVFIYVSTAAVKRPAVEKFVEFYLERGGALAQEVGYIPLPASVYELARKRYKERVTGSVFGGDGSKIGVSAEQLLAG